MLDKEKKMALLKTARNMREIARMLTVQAQSIESVLDDGQETKNKQFVFVDPRTGKQHIIISERNKK